LQNSNINHSSSSSLKPFVADPNPDLIDKDGNLKNDVSLAAGINKSRIGTIADGVSKLILLVYSNNRLQFSINGTEPDNITNGRIPNGNEVDDISSSTKTIRKK
jgi:hypothetical protein